MQFLFRKEDEKRLSDERLFKEIHIEESKTLLQLSIFMISMIGILIFLNWAPSNGSNLFWDNIFRMKYVITGGFVFLLVFSLIKWFHKDDITQWVGETRDFAIQILPLLFIGVLIAGFFVRTSWERGSHSKFLDCSTCWGGTHWLLHSLPLFLVLLCILQLLPKFQLFKD